MSKRKYKLVLMQDDKPLLEYDLGNATDNDLKDVHRVLATHLPQSLRYNPSKGDRLKVDAYATTLKNLRLLSHMAVR